jgi:hypothetical protein
MKKKKIMKAHWSYDYDTSSTVKKNHDKNNQTAQKRSSTMIEWEHTQQVTHLLF